MDVNFVCICKNAPLMCISKKASVALFLRQFSKQFAINTIA